jgi:hypothetical protein
MMNGRTKLIVGGAVAGGSMLLVAGLVVGAGLAKASTEDVDGYLHALTSEGITVSNGDESLEVGRGVCAMLRSGHTEAQVIDKIAHGTPRWFATDVVIDAHTYLCADVTSAHATVTVTGRGGGGHGGHR